MTYLEERLRWVEMLAYDMTGAEWEAWAQGRTITERLQTLESIAAGAGGVRGVDK